MNAKNDIVVIDGSVMNVGCYTYKDEAEESQKQKQKQKHANL